MTGEYSVRKRTWTTKRLPKKCAGPVPIRARPPLLPIGGRVVRRPARIAASQHPPTPGSLRDDAELAIVLLTNEDDCSAPANTALYSLNVGGSNQQNIANALGPIANYRCNQFGHLCTDPNSATPTALVPPPLNPPADAQGSATAPTLDLTNCES